MSRGERRLTLTLTHDPKTPPLWLRDFTVEGARLDPTTVRVANVVQRVRRLRGESWVFEGPFKTFGNFDNLTFEAEVSATVVVVKLGSIAWEIPTP